MDSKDPDMHVLDRWMPATKTHPACTILEDGMWLPLWLYFRKVTYAKISPKMVNPKDIAGNTEEVIPVLLLHFPGIPLGCTIFGWDFYTRNRFLIQPLKKSHSIFVDGAYWVCFGCQHSPIMDMNIRIFGVHAMECMCVHRLDLGLYSHSKEFGGE